MEARLNLKLKVQEELDLYSLKWGRMYFIQISSANNVSYKIDFAFLQKIQSGQQIRKPKTMLI